MIQIVGQHPVEGGDTDGALVPEDLVVDQTAVAFLMSAVPGALPATDLVEAAAVLGDGDPGPLLRLAMVMPPFIPAGDGLPREFSTGDNAARACNDQDAVWDRSNRPAAREAALAAPLDALPEDVFAPFTKQAWGDYWAFEMCLGWPVPDRFEPAVPEGVAINGAPSPHPRRRPGHVRVDRDLEDAARSSRTPRSWSSTTPDTSR